MHTKKQRVVSIDLLRGITIAMMILVNTPGSWAFVYAPLTHASWHGLTPTDVIFPMFIFIVGVSISYAYRGKKLTRTVFKKILLRSVKLFALGLFLNYFPFDKSFQSIRIMGVLQRIGIVFFIGSVLYLTFRWKTLLILAGVLLVGYWLWLGFVPLLGAPPSFDRLGNNWVLYIDQYILGGHMWQQDYDPEGIFSTITCVASCLIGILAGILLQNTQKNKIDRLMAAAVVCLSIGILWHTIFPINKALWSSSFVVFTSGWIFSFLALCYYISDVRKIKFGKIFIYMGKNAITIYVLSMLVTALFYAIPVSESRSLHDFLFESLRIVIPEPSFASLIYAVLVVLFYLFVGWWLHKKNILIKI